MLHLTGRRHDPQRLQGGRGVSVPAAVGDAGRVAGGGQATAAEPVEEVLGIIIFQSKLQNVINIERTK